MTRKSLIKSYIAFLFVGLLCGSMIWNSYSPSWGGEFSLLLAGISPVLTGLAILFGVFCVWVLMQRPKEWPVVVLSLTTLAFFVFIFIGYGMAFWYFGGSPQIKGLDEYIEASVIAYAVGTVLLTTWGIIR